MITKHFKARSRLSIPACGLLVLLLVAPALPVSSAPAVSAAAETAAAAPGAVIAVTTQGDEFGGPGLGCSLREAIQAANTDSSFGGCAAGSGTDTITLPAGTYTLTGAAGENANASGDLDITSSLTIQGAGSKTTFIQAGTDATNGVDRVLHVHSGATVEINGVAVMYGKAPDGTTGGAGAHGGGILNESASLTLNACSVSQNRAGDGGDGGLGGMGGYGGGIYNDAATLILNDTIVKQNASGGGGDGGTGCNGGLGGAGGGIYLNASSVVTLTGSTVSDNATGDGGSGGDAVNSDAGDGRSSGYGGGIFNQFGALTLIESSVDGNRTGIGGDGGDVTSGNGNGGDAIGSGHGGGIYNNNTGASLVAVDTTISDNEIGPVGSFGLGAGTGSAGTAYPRGNAGGLGVNNDAHATLSNCTVSGNTALSGGGIAITGDAQATLTNCTLSSNHADRDGGGIYVTAGTTASLTHVTIAGNSADWDADDSGAGGGFYTFGALTITNTLVAKNIDLGGQNPDCYGTITSRDYNLIGIGDSAGCTLPVLVHDQVGTASSPLDPILGILADHGGPTLTHPLKPTSPAVDYIPAGINGCVVGSRDQRGVLRLPLCDIGAYEIDPEVVYLPLALRN